MHNKKEDNTDIETPGSTLNCQADGKIKTFETGVFGVENASHILLNINGLELRVTNQSEKTLCLNRTILSGLSQNAIVQLNNQKLKFINGTIEIPELAAAVHSKTNTHGFFNQNQSPEDKKKEAELKAENELQLCKAAMTGDWKEVQKLCERGVDYNHKSKKYGGSTPAYLASENRNITVLKILMQFGANFNTADDEGATPGYIAAQQGYADVIMLLGKYGANLNIPYRSKTPAMIALRNGHKEALQALSHYVDINQCLNDNPLIFFSLMSYCCLVKKESIPSASDLIKMSFYYIYILTPSALYHFSIKNRKAEKVGLEPSQLEKMHSTFPDSVVCLSGKQLSDITKIIKHEYKFDMLETMLLCNADCNVNLANNGSPLIFHAVSNGYFNATRLLINHGAELNGIYNGQNLVTLAAREGLVDILQLLIQNGAEPNLSLESGLTPLFVAAQNGHKAVVKYLLLINNLDLSTPYVSIEEKLIEFSSLHGEACISNMKNLIMSKLSKETNKSSIKITAAEIAGVMGHTKIQQLITSAMNPLLRYLPNPDDAEEASPVYLTFN